MENESFKLPDKPAEVVFKKNAGKSPMSLIPRLALIELAKVLAFGAAKYSRHGWLRMAYEHPEKVKWSEVVDAGLRHLLAFGDGEDHDPESNLLHTAHAMCNCAFLIVYQVLKLGTDDRFKAVKPSSNGDPLK